MSKIGIFYGTTSGFTQVAADLVKGAYGSEVEVVKDIGKTTPEEILAYNQLIFGIPTWDDGQLQSDWWAFFPKLDKMDFTGKQFAIFGLGDQNGYPDTFLDAIGTLCLKLEERGGKLVGLWPIQGYEFQKSTALRDGKFMGLGLDVMNQDELTKERVDKWVAQVKAEFSGAVAAA